MGNRIKCLNCGDVLESLHRHDFKKCSCDDSHSVFIDGGDSYCRMGIGPLARWVTLCKVCGSTLKGKICQACTAGIGTGSPAANSQSQ